MEQGLIGARTKRQSVMEDTVEAVFYNARWLTYTQGEDRRERVILCNLPLFNSDKQIIAPNEGSRVYREH